MAGVTARAGAEAMAGKQGSGSDAHSMVTVQQLHHFRVGLWYCVGGIRILKLRVIDQLRQY